MNKIHNSSESALSYTIGFILSLVCTFLAYTSVVSHLFTGGALTGVIVLLALAQLFIQLVFFLHIGRKGSPKANTIFAVSTSIVVAILVFGTIWIMNNLNYNMMSPNDTDSYIIKDELISK